MPRYCFRVVNAQGEQREGEREAASREDLADALQREGWAVLDVAAATDDAPPALTTTAEREPGEDDGRHGRRCERLSHSEAVAFGQHLGRLAEAELPLSEGLDALASELPDGRLRRLVRDLTERLDEGQPLDAALDGLSRRFPGHLAGLIRASVQSGRVGVTLGDFVTYSQLGRSLRKMMWFNVAYPLLMLFAFLGLVLVFFKVVVIQFESIFADFGIQLPMLTRAVIGFSHVLSTHPVQVMLAPAAAAAAIWLATRLFLSASARRRLLHGVPLVGPLVRWTAVSEFAHQLGLLVESDVPLPTAVGLAGQASRDAALASDSRRAVRSLRAGRSLADAVAESRALPAGAANLLRWAQGRDALGRALHLVGSIFEAQARARASFVATALSVVVLVMIVWGVFLLVIALFMPLVSLVSALSG